MNNWYLAHWSLSEQWDVVLRLHFSQSNLGLAGALVALGLIFLFLNRRQSTHFQMGVLLAQTVFLSALCLAGDSLLFCFAWCGWGITSLALAPRDSRSDGTLLLPARWAPARAGEIALLVCAVFLHDLFNTTDWADMVVFSQEPYDYSPVRGAIALALGVFSVAINWMDFPPSRVDLDSPWRRWRQASTLLVSLALLQRLSFLSRLFPGPAEKLSVVAFAVSAIAAIPCLIWPRRIAARAMAWCALGGLLAGALIWFPFEHFVGLRGLIVFGLGVGVVVAARVRCFYSDREDPRLEKTQLPKWVKSLPEQATQFDAAFWPPLWEIPAQLCRSFGSGFVYWQGSTAQYILVTILAGTLLLFWAALKTQVIW